MKLKPILSKWVGNKTTIAKQIVNLFPCEDFEFYYEPFLGSGSIFCELLNQGYTIPNVYLSDTNFKLINFYRQVQAASKAFYREISILTYEWSNCHYREKEEYFYEKRKLYNSTARSGELRELNAALFYFLNQTCFNGLYRENSRGHFNNPVGMTAGKEYNRFSPNLVLLALWQDALQSVSLSVCDYSAIDYQPSEFTLIYLDPPYSASPYSQKKPFVAYGSQVWDWQDNSKMERDFRNLKIDGTSVFISQPSSSWNDHIFNSWQRRTFEKLSPINGTKKETVKEIVYF